jgi:hypothetical protein
MNAADLARLELAKRAYKAAQPRDAEVQTGVRRARLALGRPKARRAWFSKGLVLVVLAIGSLAYAKPQAGREVVETLLARGGAPGGKRLKPGVAVVAAREAATQASAVAQRGAGKLQSGAADETASQTAVTAAEAPSATKKASRRKTSAAPTAQVAVTTAALGASGPETPPSSVVTDWGRVGQALASGDSNEALSALGELSESDDPSTRDKADLGRAQLLMAHGKPEQACALARSLTHRRAGGRIERQAQLLLKSCTR